MNTKILLASVSLFFSSTVFSADIDLQKQQELIDSTTTKITQYLKNDTVQKIVTLSEQIKLYVSNNPNIINELRITHAVDYARLIMMVYNGAKDSFNIQSINQDQVGMVIESIKEKQIKEGVI